MQKQRRKSIILQLNLILALAEGLLVLWAYVRERSEPGSGVLFGFSYQRLAILTVVVLLWVAILLLLLRSTKSSWMAWADEKYLTRAVDQKGLFWAAIFGVAVTYVLLFLSEHQLGPLAAYRERLFPLLIWLAVLAIQFGVFVLYLRGINLEAFRDQWNVLLASFILFILFGLLLLLISLTRIGLTPDQIYWQGPGVPLLLHQVFIAALMGISFYQFLKPGNQESSRLDLLMFLAVWVLASLIWLNQPARLTHFSLEPSPPNYQIYPFSDALLYDHTAREYLVGKPIPSDFWVKPFYAFFLSVLHAFAAGDYNVLTSLQVVLLAVIPAFAYLLGARVSSRPAGVILAALLTLRERNALALSNVVQVSHVKLLLSDVFAMSFMVLALWLFFHWLEKPGQRRATLLVLGGVISLLVLTRGHPILMLPFVLGAVFLVPLPRSRLRWEAVALTFLGIMIPLLPWFWRNYQFTGDLAFQYPISPYSGQIANAYSLTPGTMDPQNMPPRYEDESDLAYYSRLQSQAANFALAYPVQVAKFVSAHYFHNLIFSYIYLPYSFRIENIDEYVRTESFWGSWQGDFSFQGKILLLLNMIVVALGFGYLWGRYKYLALVPFLIGVGYNLSVSVGRLSGWRFILPADWITLIYYSLGLMQLYHLLVSLTNRESRFTQQTHWSPTAAHPVRPSAFVAPAFAFLAISLALTQGHTLFSQRYPSKSEAQLIKEYAGLTDAESSLIPPSQLSEFLKTDNAVIVYGQASNPSFLRADKEGFDDSWPVYYFWPSYKPHPFSRLIFNLIGPESVGVVLPMENPPSAFADSIDVIVVGCRTESGEIDALAVLVQGDAPTHYFSEPSAELSCPPSESSP